MSIVCGTDLSPASRSGAAAAAALAARLRQPLWLACATEGAERLSGEVAALLRRTLAERLEEEADALARLSGVPVSAAVVDGDAPRALLDLARARGASMVVVGSQGHGASPLLRLGGTSERIALEADLPVLVVRDAAPFESWARGERALRVVTGVDFTASSAAAWSWLGRLREAGPCDVVAAHLYYSDEADARYGPAGEARAGDGADALLARDLAAFLGDLRGAGSVSIRAQVAAGRLADHLVEIAEDERADLVVVGTHRRHGPARLWSVSGGALHLARAAVATVPAAPARLAPVRPVSVGRVLAAVRLDERAVDVAAMAYGLLRGRAGEVHLLHVLPPPRDPASAVGEDAEVAERLRVLAPLDAERDGVSTAVEVARGPTARTIAEVAERLGADVICVASRARLRLGVPRVVAELLRRTPRPVLVVRPPPP